MCECCIVCIYKEKCVDFPNRCSTCTNNTGKKSYYQPAPYYVPYTPYTPWWGTTVYTCSSSYYQKQE